MRNDIDGFFWNDTPPPKVLKEKIKCVPPEPTWLSPDYLPGLAEAQRFDVQIMTDAELIAAQRARHKLIVDVESYPNYFLISFLDRVTKKVCYFETDPDDWTGMNIEKLRWIMTSFQTGGFYSNKYDIPIIRLAIHGANCEDLYEYTKCLIVHEMSYNDISITKHIKFLRFDHVDIIEVCPLQATLKIYAGRLMAQRMQDLPFAAGTVLSDEQKTIVRWYNIRSDLPATDLVFQELREQVELREVLSAEYNQDLRSKSDAQIAEAVIVSEVTRMNGARPQRPSINTDLRFCYEVPAFIKFETPLLNQALQTVLTSPFSIADNGTVELPQRIKELKLVIAGTTYQMGMGGLHSTEQRMVCFSNATHTLRDRDVTSYYPQLILNSGMYPHQMGENFLRVYQRIVTRRVHAKANKDKVTADSLKITANGTFGKLGSPWSTLYAPHLMVQVTVGGQLSLLMAIERLELRGFHVVSANTDGIVIYVDNNRTAEYESIIRQWELDTNLQTEETVYDALYSRDVNNYIAVKPDRTVKAKGAYSNPWSKADQAIFRFHKNPVNLICTEAVEAYVTKGVHPIETVHACKDPGKFVTVRTIKGGGAKDGIYFPKCVRWYYAKDEQGAIVYTGTGNKVARTDGAKPLMDLPSTPLEDVDYDWYVRESLDMIKDLGLEPPVSD